MKFEDPWQHTGICTSTCRSLGARGAYRLYRVQLVGKMENTANSIRHQCYASGQSPARTAAPTGAHPEIVATSEKRARGENGKIKRDGDTTGHAASVQNLDDSPFGLPWTRCNATERQHATQRNAVHARTTPAATAPCMLCSHRRPRRLRATHRTTRAKLRAHWETGTDEVHSIERNSHCVIRHLTQIARSKY
jgi:hypothetical protein